MPRKYADQSSSVSNKMAASSGAGYEKTLPYAINGARLLSIALFKRRGCSCTDEGQLNVPILRESALRGESELPYLVASYIFYTT